MKRYFIKQTETWESTASRVFILEVPDDVDVHSMSEGKPERLAAKAGIKWRGGHQSKDVRSDRNYIGNTDHDLPVVKHIESPAYAAGVTNPAENG